MSFCLRKSAASLLALALVTTPVFGAGFGIYENGAKASGMAGAWVAQADDAAANWYNPAALVWLEGSELQFGTNLITAGGDTEITSSDPRFGLFNEQTFEMESNLATPSHFYFRQSVSSNFAWGIGINNPFGLVTDWQQRPVTFSARKSELVTFYVNPNVALRLTDTLSIGLGVTYVDAEIEEFSREVPIDLDGNPFNGFEVIGSSNLTGTGDDFGWNVALHKKGNGYSFGLTYRSGVTVGIDGNIDFENFGPLSPFFNDSPGTADLELPDVAAMPWPGRERPVGPTRSTWSGPAGRPSTPWRSISTTMCRVSWTTSICAKIGTTPSPTASASTSSSPAVTSGVSDSCSKKVRCPQTHCGPRFPMPTACRRPSATASTATSGASTPTTWRSSSTTSLPRVSKKV